MPGEEYGAIDILINNVGGPLPGGPVALSEDNWHQQLDINLTYVFLTCKYVLPVMEAKGSGAIVNIASISGIRFGGGASRVRCFQGWCDPVRPCGGGRVRQEGCAHQYSLARAVAYATGRQNSGASPGRRDLESLLKRRQARIPMPFTGDGRDTANAALFLASDEARFITGAELIVDGGIDREV